MYFLGIAKSSLDETEDEMIDGLDSGYWSECEYAVVRSLLRRTHGAIRGWWRYLESPEAARFYEQHKTRIAREIKVGLRLPPKDPASRPWRRKEGSDRVKPLGISHLDRPPDPRNPEPRTPRT